MRACAGSQGLPCPLERILVVLQKAVDPLERLNIVVRINAVAGSVLLGMKLLKFGLPISKDMWSQSGQRANLADRVVQFLDAFDVTHAQE